MKLWLFITGLRFEIYLDRLQNNYLYLHASKYTQQNVKNMFNQLVTLNQYHLIFYTCSICLCWLYLSLIALQFNWKIFFWKINFFQYFRFHKNPLWSNKNFDWHCRTNKFTVCHVFGFLFPICITCYPPLRTINFGKFLFQIKPIETVEFRFMQIGKKESKNVTYCIMGFVTHLFVSLKLQIS